MLKKIDKNYFIILLLATALVCMIIPKGSLFGSLVDWLPQHIMFPDYFRKLFYETGDLLPNFSLALGAGQNIFNMSYYGLLNPIVLISYLLPFIDMTTYLIIANILLYITTGILGYTFLKRHFSKQVSLLTTFLLLCASPLLFHFHRHFMFVSYMPFVILGLIGVEDHFRKGKSYLLVISTFIIILMSYYYSIPSILVFILYGIHEYLKKEEHVTVKKFLSNGLKFIAPIIIAILMASVLLLPTLHTVLSGRSMGAKESIVGLLFPDLSMKGIFYDHYGLGLTALGMVSLLYGFMHKKRSNLFLSISTFVILIFPIFCYLLNGTLYVRDKVFIPFIPLFIYMIAVFLEDLIHKKIDKKFHLFVIAFSFLFLVFGCHNILYYIDVAIVLLVCYLHTKKNKKFLFLGLLLIAPAINLFVVNKIDKYVDKDVYKNAIHTDQEISAVLKKEEDFIRTYHLEQTLYNANKVYTEHYYVDSLYSSIYNDNYMHFYKNIFHNAQSYRNRLITSQNSNLLFQMFMGGKYMYSTYGMSGYKKVGTHMYENKDVLPVFYVTNHTMSEKQFDQLQYPYTVESLLRNVIVGKESSNVVGTSLKETVLEGTIRVQENIKINKNENTYEIVATDNNKLVLSLDPSLHGKVLMLDFKLGEEWNCTDGDSVIDINHSSNTLTCKSWIYKNQNQRFHYVLADHDMKELTLHFSKGTFNIEDIHLYTLDYDQIKDINKEVTKVSVDTEKTKGDVIEGSVMVQNDGYFVTSIPYDEGFTIYDNGKEVKYEKVNKSFLGFKIRKGDHTIKIVYKAPYMTAGKGMSIVGLGLFIILIVVENKKNKNFLIK